MAEVKNEEKKVDVTSEVKERSKTDRFKEHIQKIIFQELGVKVSKDKAWGLFKAMIHGTTEFVLNDEDKKLPLAGVGTFQVLETKPRGSKAGLDEEGNPVEGAKVWPCVPRFRFYPSSVIDNLLEQEYGLEDHGVEVKHYGIFKTDEDPVEKKEEKPKKVSKKKEAKVEEKAVDAEEESVDVDNFDDEI